MLTPQYTWTQDVHSFQLEMKLKGSSISQVDLYITDVYLKISFPPAYLLTLDLPHKIDNVNHTPTAIAKDGILYLKCYKETPASWDSIHLTSLTKEERRLRRNDAMERQTALEKSAASKRSTSQAENEKFALRQQMKIESNDRDTLEDLKQAEKSREEAELYESLQKLQKETAVTKSVTGVTKNKKQEEPVVVELEGGFYDISEVEKEDVEQEESEEEESVVYIPAPRSSASQPISFTPRVFNTPSRESKAHEEDDWLLKNRKHLTSHKSLNAKYARDISETDPMWLKARGDDFFKSSDYKSAINAYTEALSVDNTMLPALSNRSACFLKSGDLEACIGDCTNILGKVSDDPKSFKFKAKALMRRGGAYCQLRMYVEARADFGVALTMNPKDEMVMMDLHLVTTLAQSDEAKVQGDDAMKNGDTLSAIAFYSKSIEINEVHNLATFANRASAYLSQGLYNKCIADCTLALEMLEKDEQEVVVGWSSNNNRAANSALAAPALPTRGSAKRRKYVLKILLRRGLAYVQLEQFENAIADYTDALALEPKNESLVADLKNVKEAAKNYKRTTNVDDGGAAAVTVP